MTEYVLEPRHVRSNRREQIIAAIVELAEIRKRLEELSEAATQK